MLSGIKLDFGHGHTFDKSAVRRTEVSEEHRLIRDRDFAVVDGEGRMIDGEIIFLGAPDTIKARLERDFPRLRSTWIDQKTVVHVRQLTTDAIRLTQLREGCPRK